MRALATLLGTHRIFICTTAPAMSSGSVARMTSVSFQEYANAMASPPARTVRFCAATARLSLTAPRMLTVSSSSRVDSRPDEFSGASNQAASWRTMAAKTSRRAFCPSSAAMTPSAQVCSTMSEHAPHRTNLRCGMHLLA